MAQRTSYLNVRIDPATKAAGNKVLRKVGLTPSDAISLFYKQIEMHDGIPFPIRVPNAASRQALKEARAMRGRKGFSGSTEEFMARILAGEPV